MTSLFKKLNYRDQKDMVVLNAPDSFGAELESMAADARIHRKLPSKKDVSFVMAFVTTQAEIDQLTPKIVATLTDDAVLWFCYPKGTSKKYKCDFNRDTGWKLLRDAGYDTVRAVAIDEDWSALRFRPDHLITRR